MADPISDALLALRDLVDLGAAAPDSLWRAVSANLNAELVALRLLLPDDQLVLRPRGKTRFRIQYELRSRKQPAFSSTRVATFRTTTDFFGNIKLLAQAVHDEVANGVPASPVQSRRGGDPR